MWDRIQEASQSRDAMFAESRLDWETMSGMMLSKMPNVDEVVAGVGQSEQRVNRGN